MKKLTSILLALLFILNISAVAVGATDGNPENEQISNDVFSQAQAVLPDEVIKGTISAENIVDFYKITLDKRQRVTMYTAGTHYEIYHPGYEFGWISESLAFDIYCEKPYANDFYTKIDKESCYYYYDIMKDEDFELEDDGFEVDGEKWEQTEDMVLDAGTYYFVFKFDSLGKTADYKFMYKLSEAVPVIYNRYHSEEFNLNYKSVEAGEFVHLRVADGEVASWKSADPKVAKVNKKGKVTTLKKGETEIVATLTNGEELICNLTVTSDPILKVNGKKTEAVTLNKGKTIKVKLQGKAKGIKNTYTNTEFAKITSGRNAKTIKIKGLKKGTTTLRIKVNGVKTLKLTVNVK